MLRPLVASCAARYGASALVAFGISLLAASARGQSVVETDSHFTTTGPTVPTASANLLSTANGSTLSANPTQPSGTSGSPGAFGTSSTWSVLTDGSYGGVGTSGAPALATAWLNANNTLAYTLNTTANPFGYTITNIDAYTGWDSGRIDQSYSVYYSTVSNPTFTLLKTVSYAHPGGTADTGLQVDLATTFLSGVAAIEFVAAGSQQNAFVGYRELAVAGSAGSVWNGGSGSTSNWNDAANWGGTAPTANTPVIFGGTNRVTPVNNFAANTQFSTIGFASGAAAFTLTGNAINLAGNVVNNSSNLQTVNIPLALQTNLSLNAANGNLAFGGVISGASGVTLPGSNMVTFTSANTFSGSTTISAGTLQLGDGTNNGSVAGDIVNNATLKFNNAASQSYSGIISGSGSLVKAGAGMLSLSANNSYNGATVVNGGTLRLNPAAGHVVSFTSVGSTTWTDPTTVSSVRYLVVGGGGGGGGGTGGGGGAGGFLDSTMNVTPGTQYTVTVGAGGAGGSSTRGSNGGNSIFGPSIMAVGGGGGGSNLPSGVVTPNSGGSGGGGSGGPSAAGAAGTSGQGNSGGSANGWSSPYYGGGGGGAGFAGAVHSGGNGSSSNITGSPLVYAGGGGGGSFNDNSVGSGGTGGGGNGGIGGGTATASLNATFYGGGGGAQGGNSGTQAGSGFSGVVYLFYTPSYVLPATTAVQVSAGSTLDLFGTSQPVGSLADFGGGGGTVTNTAATPAALTLTPTSGSTTFSGVINDGGSSNAVSLTMAGAGTQVLAGANTYSGATNILGGTLRLAATGSLGASSAVSVGGGTASGTPTLTGTGTASGAVTINGAGGGVAGHLAPGLNTSGNSGAIGTLTVGSLTLNSGAMLDYDFGTPGVVGGPGMSDLTTMSGALTLPSSGSVTLNLFDNANAGGLGSIDNGTYKLFSYSSVNNFSSTSILVGASPLTGRSYSFTNTGTELDVTIATEAWTGGASTGVWETAGNWQAGAIPGSTSSTTNTDTATFNSAGNNQLNITLAADRNLQSIVFDTPMAGAYVVGTTGGNQILLTNNGGIQTTGTVVNTQTVNAPIVIEGAAATFTSGSPNAPLIIGGNIKGNINGGGTTTLTINGANGGLNIISGVISDNNTTHLVLVKDGAGTWILNNANTYTGGTTISNGTLQLGDGTNNGSVVGNILNNSALTFNNGSSQTYSGVISGSGSLNVNGPAPLILTGLNTHMGATTIARGASLQLGDGTTNGTVGGNIVNNAALTIANPTAQSYSGSISGPGALTKSAPGILTLSSASTYSGATVISDGTLRLNPMVVTTSFTTVGTTQWTAPAGVNSVQYLVVAGGGGGGGETGAGGGGGGFLTGTTSATPGSGYTVTVGAGGAGGFGFETGTTLGSNGGYSSFGSFFAAGGGAGGSNGGHASTQAGNNGGSGGGGSNGSAGSAGISGQGFAGGASANFSSQYGTGGGGGAGASGGNGSASGGNGGAGLPSNITGSTVYYGGGGGGGIYNNSNGGTGGQGGGGNGGIGGGTATASLNAISYGGGGGGQGGNSSTQAGAGFAGIVGLKYAPNILPITTPVQIAGSSTLDLFGANQTVASLADFGGSGGSVINSAASPSVLTLSASGGSTSFSGVIAGGGGALSLVISGAGTQVLTGANTYTGGTTLNGGTLRVANSTGNGTGSGDVTLNAGTLASGIAGSGGSGSIGGNLLAGSAAHTIAPGGVGTIGTLSVGGGITTSSNTTLNFDLGAPVSGGSYAGDLIALTGSSGLTVGSGAQITFGSNPSVPGDYRLFQGSNLGSTATGNFVLPSPPTNTIFYTLSASADPGYLDLVVVNGLTSWNTSGGGSWTIAGNWNNGVPNSPGSSAVFDNSLGGSGGGTVTLDGPQTVGHLKFNNAAASYNLAPGGGSLTIDNSGATAIGVPSIEVLGGSHTISAPISLAAGVTMTTAADPAPSNPSLTISGAISGSGDLTKAGAGTLRLSGTNTYGGATNVQSGTLRLGTSSGANVGSLPSGSNVVLGSGSASGVFQLGDAANPVNQTVASLSVSGTGAANAVVGGNTANSTLTVNNSSGVTYSGALGGAGVNQNNLGLAKSGSGVLTLSGATSTYAGPTTISGGVLRVGASTTISQLIQNGSFEVPVLGANNATYYNALSGGQQAQLIWVGGGNGPRGGPALVNAVTGWGYTNPYPDGNQVISLQDDATVTQTVNFPAPGTYTLSWSLQQRPGYAASPVSVLLDNASVTSISPASSWSSYSTTLNVSSAGPHTVQFSGTQQATDTAAGLDNVSVMAAVGGAVSPYSDMSLSGASAVLDMNDFSASIASLSGVAGSTVALGAGMLTVGFNGASTTYSGTIADAGGLSTNTGGKLVKIGVGTLTLAGANAYTGGTTLNGGTLSLGSSGAIGPTGTISFGGGTLQFTSANTTDYSSVFSNAAGQAYSIDTNDQNVTFASPLMSSSGSLTKLGTGTLTLISANTYAGATTISAGTLQLGDGASLAHDGSLATANVANNSALVYNIVGNQSAGYPISGTGTVTKLGSGTQALSGANTYSGGTAVNAGTLVAINSTSLGTGTVTVASGATLRVIASPMASVTNFGGNGTNWTLTGGPTISADVLTLTDNNNGEGRATFFNAPQPVLSGSNGFTASFVYTATGGNPYLADGMAFIVQSDPRGAAAIGSGDGDLGYGGAGAITPSVALEINVYPGRTQGTTIATGGATQAYNSFPNVASGDQIQVSFTYNPTANSLTETLTDSTANASYTNTLTNVNLASLLGGNSAYIGFSGGTGGYASMQQIGNFSYTLAAGAFANSVTLPAASNATIDVGASAAASAVAMGGLIVNAGGAATLNVTAATAPTDQSYSLTLGAVTLGSGLTLNVANNGMGTGTLRLGALNDGGTPRTVNLTGPGTVVLTSPATTVTAGATFNVNAGTLRVANTTGSATGAGNVTLNAGTLASGPVGSIGGNVLAGTGAHLIAPGGVGSIGTLSLGGITTSSTAGNTMFNFDLSGTPVTMGNYTGGDLINLTGSGLTIGAQAAIAFGVDPTTPGEYRLFGGNIGTWTSGTLASSFSLPAAPNNTISYHLAAPTDDPGFIDLVVGPGAFTAYWNSTGLGTASWNNGGNWTNLNSVPNAAGATAIFDNSLGSSATSTATLDGNETVGHLIFNNNSVSYTIAQGSSGSLTIDNNASGATGIPSIDVLNSGSHTISAPVFLANGVTITATADPGLSPALTISGAISGSGGLIKAGLGTLQLSSANSYSGGTTVSAGALRTTADGALNGGPLSVNPSSGSATVRLSSNESVSNLSGAPTGSATALLTVDAGKTLNVGTGNANAQTTVTLGAGSIVNANSGLLEIDGVTNLGAGSALNVNGGATLKFNLAGANSTVGTGVVATIASGATLELAGTTSALADPSALSSPGPAANPTQRAEVQNGGTLQIDDGAAQQVGGIDGSGGVVVSDTTGANPTSLTADHINQTSLVIGAGSTFTLAPSDSNGDPMVSQESLGGSLVLAGSLTPSSSFIASSHSLLGAGSASSSPTVSLGGGMSGASIAAVPEPSTIALLALGAIAMLGRGRRKRSGSV